MLRDGIIATRAIVTLCLTIVGGCAGVDAAPSHTRPVGTSALASVRGDAATSGGASFGFARGSAAAPVVVLEFSDFGCFYCASFARTVLPEVAREFLATGRVRWQLVPLATGATPHAKAAAAAAVCAAEQNRAWAMHDRLFQMQREWSRFGDPTPHFAAYARDIDLDVPRFATCLQDPRTRETIASMHRLTQAMNVRVAPTFFIAGRRVEGALPIDGMREVLQAALSVLQ